MTGGETADVRAKAAQSGSVSDLPWRDSARSIERTNLFGAERKRMAAFFRLAVFGLLALSVIVTESSTTGYCADPDVATLRQVLPQADAFGTSEGDPPAIPGYRNGSLVGYVLSSWQVVQSTGYSAKPLEVLVGLDLDGVITGIKLSKHHEPILIIGIRDSDLEAFTESYIGLDIRQPIGLGASQDDGAGLDAVSGATISSLIINDAILRSARAVASRRGILGKTQSELRFATFEPATWNELLVEGSLTRLTITVQEARQAIESNSGNLFAEGVPEPPADAVYVELFAGLATPARIGQNLLGERLYGSAITKGRPGDQVLFVAGRGLYSFKGHDYRKSGVFDRLQLVQGTRTFRLRAANHTSLAETPVSGAPDLREIALFSVPENSGFDPASDWSLELLIFGAGGSDPASLALFTLPYHLPDLYRATATGDEDALAASAALWIETWRFRQWDIAILSVALLILTAILVFQDVLVKRRNVYITVRIGFLLFTLVWIGWIAGAQLSVVNVLTFLDAVMHEFRWDFFLLEPLIFILWGYVAIALLFWGRGVFCGWLCPFGALQELLARFARLLRIVELRLPFVLHERLWPVKYIFFIALFALFLHIPEAALKGAEVEPFKTAIVLKFDRDWPFVVYALVLLTTGLFINRFYCRYICPLGGALAIPARIRMFEWLKRRWQCGTPCQSCAYSCPVQAIHPEGKINPNECIHCLNCQANYHDWNLCPPLVERRRRRERAKKAVEKAGTESQS